MSHNKLPPLTQRNRKHKQRQFLFNFSVLNPLLPNLISIFYFHTNLFFCLCVSISVYWLEHLFKKECNQKKLFKKEKNIYHFCLFCSSLFCVSKFVILLLRLKKIKNKKEKKEKVYLFFCILRSNLFFTPCVSKFVICYNKL